MEKTQKISNASKIVDESRTYGNSYLKYEKCGDIKSKWSFMME